MRAEERTMQRLGKGGENSSSLEARAGAFLGEARQTLGLTDAEIGAIGRRLAHQGRAQRGLRFWPALTALAVLLAAGSAIALVGGWRPVPAFLERKPSPLPVRTKELRPRLAAVQAATHAPIAAESPPTSVAAPAPGTRPSVVARRWPRQEPSLPPPSASSQGAALETSVSAEAQSLSDGLARWRRDGDAEAALALLSAHARRFSHGVLSVEARVARAEILLALGRRDQALVVLDSLSLTSLPRIRELQTLRGELRAQAGRCRDARVDLSPVLLDTAADDLGKRAARALANCP